MDPKVKAVRELQAKEQVAEDIRSIREAVEEIRDFLGMNRYEATSPPSDDEDRELAGVGEADESGFEGHPEDAPARRRPGRPRKES